MKPLPPKTQVFKSDKDRRQVSQARILLKAPYAAGSNRRHAPILACMALM